MTFFFYFQGWTAVTVGITFSMVMDGWEIGDDGLPPVVEIHEKQEDKYIDLRP